MDEKILEQAGEYADGLVMGGIARSRTKAHRPIDFDGTCSCGAGIPQQRIEYELYNCVDCQTVIESRKRLYGT
jgi:RNA polymerase-binding transcription factor DksA